MIPKKLNFSKTSETPKSEVAINEFKIINEKIEEDAAAKSCLGLPHPSKIFVVSWIEGDDKSDDAEEETI